MLAVTVGMGCSGDDACGPTIAPTGISLEVAGQTLSYDDFTAAPNNDCPVEGSPTAITVAGSSTVGGSIILCLSRPDRVGGNEALSFDGDVRIISVAAQLDCPVVIDRTREPTAITASFSGYCGNGVDPAGFSLELFGSLSMLEQCEGAPDAPVTAEVSGAVTVLPE